MTPARHHQLFAAVFARYTAFLLGRRFHAVWVRGSPPRTLAPLVVAAQHVAWWDPIVLFHLSRTRFDGVHYTMMEEANLARLRFFGRLGAFGIDRSSRGETLAAARYALARLAEPGARVWVFPQGRLAPADVRPLGCEPGAAWLAAHARVPVVAVALRYEFLDAQFPQAFVSFGPPRLVEALSPDPVDALLTAEADTLRDAIIRRDLSSFDLAVRGRRSISDLFGGRESGKRERRP
jgi:1-acyl-sn-glycerol-3-phosphate acyltransferase